MRYLLDTNILLNHLRGGTFAEAIEKRFDLFTEENITAISIISKGEIHSLALQLSWGAKRLSQLDKLLNDLLILDIYSEDIVQKYAEIDAYSQGKLISQALPSGMSARNMGKNDIWIAATAAVIEATLLTTDKDFEHLNDVFLPVCRLEIESFLN
jgi:tRNA(fMet)-specific endonuclease VapC